MIHSILMRIRILDPHWKKRIRVISIKFTEFFNKAEFQFFCLIFSLIYMLKLDEPFRNHEIFIISLFSIVQIWGLRVNFFLQFFVNILRIWIQEAKILRIQRIRNLSTTSRYYVCLVKWRDLGK